MFEITYKESASNTPSPFADGAVYDFTFENRFDIFHIFRNKLVEYHAFDCQTTLTSLVLKRKSVLDPSDFPLITPDILDSIKYTGDRRYLGATAYPPLELIDVIFRAIMPQYGYAIREQQIEMAKSIYLGLTTKSVTLCEAEVGTGKTMAYLVAGFVAKKFNTIYRFRGYPVTITTSSIELQKSIMEKEIPLLSDMLQDYRLISRPLTAVLRKGKEHYFCLKRYYEHLNSLKKATRDFSQTIQTLESLHLPDVALDLDAMQIPLHIKSKICSKGSCKDCPGESQCSYMTFLKDASKPYRFDFQITNHNLFLMTQKMRKNHSIQYGLIPCNYCIVDEAHKLAETALDVFGEQYSFSDVPDLLKAIKHNIKKGSRNYLEFTFALDEAGRLSKKLSSMFSHYQSAAFEDSNMIKIRMTDAMYDTITALETVLREIHDICYASHAMRNNYSAALADRLSAFLDRQNNMFWLSCDSFTGATSFCCAPTNLKSHLSQLLWKESNIHFAMTSGTMMDDTGFSFFKDELGISDSLSQHGILEFSCESPFDYKNHTKLYITENTPFPDMDDPEYIPAVAREVIRLVKATHGHTAILFTSYKALNAVYDLVKDELQDYPLIKMSRSDKSAISRFKASGNGVLFASGTMWEGVDCAGDILSSVIIVRLPFPLRTQEMEYKKKSCATTQDFVQRYAVPQMIIKLRQGAGRLIRTEQDTGILAILDARASKSGPYRKRLLKTLEKYPLVSTVDQVSTFINSVKDLSYKEGK